MYIYINKFTITTSLIQGTRLLSVMHSLDLLANVQHPSFKSKICLLKLISSTDIFLWSVKTKWTAFSKVLTAKCYTVQNNSFDFTTIIFFLDKVF